MHALQRYVLVEVLKIFVAGLIALTTVMLIVGVVQDAANKNLPLGQILRLIPFLLPHALRIAVPVTLLLAATMVYGRLSGSNEIVALKAMGISPWAVLWPSYVLAFVLSVATVQLNEYAASWGRNGVKRVLTQAVEDIAYSLLRSQRHYSDEYLSMKVNRVEGRTLHQVSLNIEPRGRSPAISITAEQAELRFLADANLLQIKLVSGSVEAQGRGSFQFPDEYVQEVPLYDSKTEDTRPSSLPTWRIYQEMDNQRERIAQYEREMAVQAAQQLVGGVVPRWAGAEWNQRHLDWKAMRQELFRLITEPYRRWATGFSCLFFTWVGAPLAIRRRNADYLTSFFLCFAPILIVYYPLMEFGVDGSKHGTVPPLVIWLGNALLFLWGYWLLRRVMRY